MFITFGDEQQPLAFKRWNGLGINRPGVVYALPRCGLSLT